MSDIEERKNKAIPTVKMPSIREYVIDTKDEQLVSLRDRGLIVKSQYNQQGIPGSYPDCYARETVDLTLCNENGEYLDMGTKFDEFGGRAWTNHFEEIEHDDKVRDNRRLLYNTMIEAGFTNLPSEWWHYDYGDKFWAYFTENKALYEGVMDMDFPDRFPLR